ncbi:MAG: chemotaxis protein CheB [Pontiellaceae bacterium]|nr:chemotaxis protein CheB [Pontiellaceae bacterium]
MIRTCTQTVGQRHTQRDRFRAVVIGVSAGGLQALSKLLPALPESFPLPVLIVQHRSASTDGFLVNVLDELTAICVKEAEDKEALRPGYVYIAPADYHLLVERDETLCLSVDPKVNYSRPSIDVLFESAACVWGSALIGVVLTGANADGTSGLIMIKQKGGLTIAQDPATADFATMPQSAIDSDAVDHILPIGEVGTFLNNLLLPKKNSRI